MEACTYTAGPAHLIAETCCIEVRTMTKYERIGESDLLGQRWKIKTARKEFVYVERGRYIITIRHGDEERGEG